MQGTKLVIFLQLTLNGLAVGCIYGLVALGFVLIYKATELVNFAQGDLLMLGAFVAYMAVIWWGLDYWLAFLISVVTIGIFGARKAKTKLQVGRDDSNLQLDLTSHPWPGQQRGLISGLLSYQIDDANAVTTSQRLRVGRLVERERMERTDYAEFQRAKVKSEAGVTVSQASSIAGTSQWNFRNVDSQVLPTRGVTTSVSATVGHSFSTLESSGYFGRAYGRLTGYLPLPWNWYASGRGEWGQVIARSGTVWQQRRGLKPALEFLSQPAAFLPVPCLARKRRQPRLK